MLSRSHYSLSFCVSVTMSALTNTGILSLYINEEQQKTSKETLNQQSWKRNLSQVYQFQPTTSPLALNDIYLS